MQQTARCLAVRSIEGFGVTPFTPVGKDDGVLTVRAGATGPEYNLLPYPNDLLKDATPSRLLGSSGIQVFLGSYGPKELAVIDPADAPHFRYIELPFRRVDFALDPGKPSTGYVLTEDGSLHRVDLLKAEITASAKLTAPYSMDGHWNDPRPRIALAGDEIVLTDPNASLVRRISAGNLTELGTVPVEGKPYNIAATGGSGVTH